MSKYRVFTPKEEAKFRALQEGGNMSCYALAQAMHISPHTMRRILREGNTLPASPLNARHEEFRQWWLAGKSRKEIAAHFKLSKGSIQRWYLRLGLSPRPGVDANVVWTKEEDAVIRHYLRQNARRADIASVLPGRSPMAVQTRAAQLGHIDPALRGKANRSRVLPKLLTPKIKECITRHGPSPTWRIIDYVGEKHTKVRNALITMERAGEIVATGTRLNKTWDLPEQTTHVSAQ